MPRRGKIAKRQTNPDSRYGSTALAKFINMIMLDGKKTTAERIVYDALTLVGDQMKTDPIEIFDQALKNATPLLQVKSRRVGGATYQVPIEVKTDRGMMLAMRWLISFARGRTGRSMAEKLAAEFVEAAQGQGAAVKKRQDTHRMAEANKAFAHYRW
jgi:small subunit ribosomal protein S7